jgi:polar amino acid transport system substrate-binding protein
VRFAVRFVFYISLLNVAFSGIASAETVVRVVAYPFSPFLSEDLKSGMTPDLLKLLNETQDRYHFELSVTSERRRYLGLQRQEQDMILFEMPEWGWLNSGVKFTSTREIVRGEEVYIALRKKAENQAYFDNLKDKHIGAQYGYHYRFADFNADRSWLEKHFRIVLTHSQSRIIDLIILRKIDVGVMNMSYLKEYIKSNPEIGREILISEKWDQQYSLKAIIRDGSPITANEFEGLLENLRKDERFEALLKEYNIGQYFSF